MNRVMLVEGLDQIRASGGSTHHQIFYQNDIVLMSFSLKQCRFGRFLLKNVKIKFFVVCYFFLWYVGALVIFKCWIRL